MVHCENMVELWKIKSQASRIDGGEIHSEPLGSVIGSRDDAKVPSGRNFFLQPTRCAFLDDLLEVTW